MGLGVLVNAYHVFLHKTEKPIVILAWDYSDAYKICMDLGLYRIESITLLGEVYHTKYLNNLRRESTHD